MRFMVATMVGYMYSERSEPGQTAMAVEYDLKRERCQESERHCASGLGVTYQYPVYEMGPSQPFFGLDASTCWFKEPFCLH